MDPIRAGSRLPLHYRRATSPHPTQPYPERTYRTLPACLSLNHAHPPLRVPDLKNIARFYYNCYSKFYRSYVIALLHANKSSNFLKDYNGGDLKNYLYIICTESSFYIFHKISIKTIKGNFQKNKIYTQRLGRLLHHDLTENNGKYFRKTWG